MLLNKKASTLILQIANAHLVGSTHKIMLVRDGWIRMGANPLRSLALTFKPLIWIGCVIQKSTYGNNGTLSI